MRRSLAIVLGFAGVLAAVGACSSANSSGGNGGSGNASAAGGTAGTGGGTIGDSSTGGGGGIGAACAAESHDGELVPVDMFVMLDRSGSMSDDNKWSNVTGAISNFVKLPNLTKLGMGLAFFPITAKDQPPLNVQCTDDSVCGVYGPCEALLGACLGSFSPFNTPVGSCVAPDYTKPAVQIADLPAVGSQITSAIAGQSAGGDTTPMAPALEGAIDYAQGWAQQHTDHVTVVVLATDGEPSGCNPNRIDTVVQRAQEGLNQNPSIKTFVIGVGSALITLNDIAKAGGTDQAIIVTTGNAAQEFLDALDKIRGSLSCKYEIPTPTSGDPNYDKVNVAFTPKGGQQEVFPKVETASDCQGAKGWYYDNPQNPTLVNLCPASCDLVENAPDGGIVEVLLGCNTVVK